MKWTILLTALAAYAQSVPGALFGPPPRTPDPGPVVAASPARADTVPPVDRSNRQAVVNLYNSVYAPAVAVPNDWNGSVAGCNAGSTSVTYMDATMDAVNYFRAMTGLPSAAHEAVRDGRAQQAALMMTANNSLNHFPPPEWNCYTAEGADAASHSNLASAPGPTASPLYMSDNGTDTSLGHRRWILFPLLTHLGAGSTNVHNVLLVISTFGTRPGTPATVAWPPAGFVPYQVVYPRWSFSVNTSAVVSFEGATVSMTRGGSPVSLTAFPNANGFGDNTIGWEPTGLSFPGGMPDDVVSVQVNHVVVGGVPTNYTYGVTVIDPALVRHTSSFETPNSCNRCLSGSTTLARTTLAR